MGAQREHRDRRGISGGIVGGDQQIAIAATLAVFGLPAQTYLTTDDPAERLVLVALARKADSIVTTMQRNQGVHVANAMVKAKLGG
jgi:hypothetical protein